MRSTFQDIGGSLSPSVLVTTLPLKPLDGQQVYFQSTSMASSGITWVLRYNAKGGTNKWEYIGGPSLNNEVAASAATAVTHSTYQDLTASTGPSIGVPLIGEYDVSFGGLLSTAAIAGSHCMMSVDAASGGGSAADDAWAVRVHTAAAVAVNGTPSRTVRMWMASGGTFTAKYRSSAGGLGQVSAAGRWMNVIPVRVG